MSYDLSAPNPVYLPKPMTPDDDPEDYRTAITQNEDAINQNFSALTDSILDLQSRLAKYEEGK